MKLKDKVHVKFSNIDWDVDDDCESELPTELEHDFKASDLKKRGLLEKDEVDGEWIVNDQFDDFLCDWLSDTYGWCANGFSTEMK